MVIAVIAKPFGEDAQKLLDLWIKGIPGAIYEHTDMLGLLGYKSRDDKRYKNAVSSARKRFYRMTGVWMIAVRSVGLQIPIGSEQINYAHKRLGLGVRAIKRAQKIAAGVSDERLDDNGRSARDILVGGIDDLVKHSREKTAAIAARMGPYRNLPRPE